MSRLRVLPVLFLGLWMLSFMSVVSAATITVAAGDSAGLVAAITTANSNGEPDIIELAAGSTYTLTSVADTQFGANGLPSITSEITINGNGAIIERDTSAPAFRIVHVANTGTLTLNNVTLRNGLRPGPSTSTTMRGGAILNRGATTLIASIITNNNAVYAGGIENYSGTLDIHNSVIENNGATITSSGTAGGISNFYNAVLTLTDSTIQNNQSVSSGGGLRNHGTTTLIRTKIIGNNNQGMYNGIDGVLTIIDSTFHSNVSNSTGGALAIFGRSSSPSPVIIQGSSFFNNTSNSAGGAITSRYADVTIVNSTFSGNSARTVGTAIHNQSASDMHISFSTIVNNTSVLGANAALQNFGSLQITNSIVANNSRDCNANGAWAAMFVNLDSDGTCSGFGITANPVLGPLQANGGTTLTHAFAGPSVAIDAAASCNATGGSTVTADQRGIARPQGGACDLGAVEDDTGIPTVTPGLPTATFTVTNTPGPTNTPFPTYTPSITRTLGPTNTPYPTYTPSSTVTPGPTNTPLPTMTFTPAPSNTPLPTNTWTPVPSNTPVPTSTWTPEPSNTPAPTNTWTPEPTDTPEG